MKGTAQTSRIGVIGAGLGGLSVAIHLRLEGRDVTIFEANRNVGGRANLIESHGFRFDTGPSLLNYPWVFEDLFAAAGRKLSDYVTLLPVDPSVQFRWLDGTEFTLSSNVKNLLEECERLQPGAGPAMTGFLRDAGAKYTVSFHKLVTMNDDNAFRWLGRLSPQEMWNSGVWRSLDAELGRFFTSRHIREALGSYGMYLGGSPFDLPGLFSILAYGELAYGLWLPKGGVYGMVQGIERMAREIGVEIRTGSKVTEVIRAEGRATGIRLEDGCVWKCDAVVSNVDVPTTKRDLLMEASAKSQKMTPGVVTFYWGIRGSVDDIGHHTIFLPENYRKSFDELCKQGRIPEELPFYTSIPSATDLGLAPPGDTAMFVLVPTPVLSELGKVDWGDTIRAIKTKVLARLARHGIWLEPERLIFEEVWTPEDWHRRFGLFDGSAFGASHTLFQMGPFRAANYSKEVDGLYYVGASTTPGTGMPMVVLGGKMTAERIATRVH